MMYKYKVVLCNDKFVDLLVVERINDFHGVLKIGDFEVVKAQKKQNIIQLDVKVVDFYCFSLDELFNEVIKYCNSNFNYTDGVKIFKVNTV